ncbi:hypothetical protein M885DRAFT_14066 [Pelagophyceae sp. CCMP2097]|nr:hypothetical protein M885DRAFT_14066 [Pelagophyceae sp. CCMP2097]
MPFPKDGGPKGVSTSSSQKSFQRGLSKKTPFEKDAGGRARLARVRGTAAAFAVPGAGIVALRRLHRPRDQVGRVLPPRELCHLPLQERALRRRGAQGARNRLVAREEEGGGGGKTVLQVEPTSLSKTPFQILINRPFQPAFFHFENSKSRLRKRPGSFSAATLSVRSTLGSSGDEEPRGPSSGPRFHTGKTGR